MPAFKVVIPSRYASTRLPGKPLLKLAGKPLVQHVFERASESGADEVIIATDDSRIADAANAFGANVCMTDARHTSGTDRIEEVARKMNWADDEIVVNLQGDEPLVPASLIQSVAADLAKYKDASVSTLCVALRDQEEVFDSNVVKVVMDFAGYALYFSRASIPWDRQHFATRDQELKPELCYRHLGLYAYRTGFLHRFVGWDVAPIEKLESLEQLRVLYQGERIHVLVSNEAPPAGVDTQADLDRMEALLNAR